MMARTFSIGLLAGGMMAAALAVPAIAGVKEGIAAWQRGDYPAAIAQWQPAAAAGDADAEFNLAQAYKLGRGVPQDIGQAQAWYYKAAQQGHPQAEANYGLILFQDGDRAGAMPWLQKAAQLGEPRAQYVVGTALFNGDLADKDWPRAYAYMTRAAAAGLPQAASSLAQMDSFMPIGDRQRGVALARSLAAPTPPPPAAGGLAATPVPSNSGSAFGTPGITIAALPPSAAAGEQVAAAAPPAKPSKKNKGKGKSQTGPQIAFAEPTPTANFNPPDSTAEAPSSPAPSAMAAPPPPSLPPANTAPPRKPVSPTPVKPARAAEATAKLAPGGKWRVQLGAFGNAAGANAAWKTASRAPGLGGLDHFAVAAGPVTRLQAGPFATREEATKACVSAKAGGASCFVVAAR